MSAKPIPPGAAKISFSTRGQVVASLQISALSKPASGIAPLVTLTSEEAKEYGEEPVQLLEGSKYEFLLEGDAARYRVRETVDSVVTLSKITQAHGFIETRSHVGRLELVLEDASGREVSRAAVEVRTAKLDYRKDFRAMIEFIARECSEELLLSFRSPATTKLAPSRKIGQSAAQQRFFFLKALLQSARFGDAINRITRNPHQRLHDKIVERSIHQVSRLRRAEIRQLQRGGRRVEVPSDHPLKAVLPTVPRKLFARDRAVTVNTPENRFVKYSLTVFLDAVRNIENEFRDAKGGARAVAAEAARLRGRVEQFLGHNLFSEIDGLDALPMGSPVLQRQPAYRQVMRTWLNFLAASKLVWSGGEEVYDAGRKDVAVLYEYWLFFHVLKVVDGFAGFDKDEKAKLFKLAESGQGLTLKTGEAISFEGLWKRADGVLRTRFSYNRTFTHSALGESGSWTKSMKPDFTITFWPDGFSEAEAENLDLATHIHFDAKYKIEYIDEVAAATGRLGPPLDGGVIYTRVDLLKMHSYRDAIRRSGGAFILYPGTGQQSGKHYWRKFHELLPGVGAFVVRPLVDGEADGIDILKAFLEEVGDQLAGRCSQYERLRYFRNKALGDVAKSRKRPSRVADVVRAANARPKHPVDFRIAVAVVTEGEVAAVVAAGQYERPARLVYGGDLFAGSVDALLLVPKRGGKATMFRVVNGGAVLARSRHSPCVRFSTEKTEFVYDAAGIRKSPSVGEGFGVVSLLDLEPHFLPPPAEQLPLLVN